MKMMRRCRWSGGTARGRERLRTGESRPVSYLCGTAVRKQVSIGVRLMWSWEYEEGVDDGLWGVQLLLSRLLAIRWGLWIIQRMGVSTERVEIAVEIYCGWRYWLYWLCSSCIEENVHGRIHTLYWRQPDVRQCLTWSRTQSQTFGMHTDHIGESVGLTYYNIHNSILGNTEEAYVSLSWRVVDPPSVHWREQTNESMDWRGLYIWAIGGPCW